MHTYRAILVLLLFVVGSLFSVVYAQQKNLAPNNGLLPKNEGQQSVDWVVMAHDYNYATNDTLEINLRPKYGSLPKNDALKASDAKLDRKSTRLNSSQIPL